ncbi:UNVERIFIED_CONTAM: hypothetical protein GTU68_049971 [Idotea baltica]|nr:hypothetical protein [Idotea baltica]
MTDLELEGLPKGDHPSVGDYAYLFINDVPLLDVRAPVEFKQGAFPNSINIPLMTDAEREAVGIEYKEQGQDAAILLGAKLVDPQAQAERKKRWAEFFVEANQNKKSAINGLRSQISQQWVFDETGIHQPRVEGGYKAMRRFLIDTIERISAEMSFVVLGGRTGSGKTRVLKQLGNSIDLEGLANHRGSAFGPTATPQPTQINFENALAIELLKQEAAGHKVFVIEDEARNVGSVGLPSCLYEAMQKSPIVMLEVSAEERNKISIEEYILDTQKSFDEVYGKEQGEVELSKHLLGSLAKIKKRLGGVRYQQAQKQMQDAINLRNKSGSIEGFIPIVNALLLEYYDPMYDYQSQNKQDRVEFRGGFDEALSYLKQASESKTAKK